MENDLIRINKLSRSVFVAVVAIAVAVIIAFRREIYLQQFYYIFFLLFQL